MPKIVINVNDNTGVPYSGDETVIFVPGSASVTDVEKLDPNNCIYIEAGSSGNLQGIFGQPAAESLDVINYIQKYLELGFDVIYCYQDIANNKPANFNFLRDKNSYNIKYLTTGASAALQLAIATGPDDVALTVGDVNYTIKDNGAGALAAIATFRNDCVVLVDIDYSILKGNDNYLSVNVEELSTAIQEWFSDGSKNNIGEQGALHFPNVKTSIVPLGSIQSVSTVMPGYMAYLAALSRAIGKDQNWLSVAGVNRGGVSSLGFTPELMLSKYHLDENLIVDSNGASLNGIVTIRGYGPTLWGDRTLLVLESSVKALGYLSLKTLVCDLAKRAYQSSIDCTYESNNEVTWINFKTSITELLNQMVASGVLDNYTIRKVVSKQFNEIKCLINLSTNLPVEDFDVTINLENAEVTIEEGGNQ